MTSAISDVVDVKPFLASDTAVGDEIYLGWRAAQLHDVPDVEPFARENIQAMLETPPHGWIG
jgi:hypothetical protein